ncbi:MAG: hypothetical protein GTO24_25070 [candidate division Zixibacteria bacterium]|nr:hypothetical protein [candidate division Zixibacteria bacterium]
MLSKLNLYGTGALVFVLLFLVLTCFAGNVVYADGAIGQWPASSSDSPDTSESGDGDSEEIPLTITIATLLQVIL